MLSLDIKTTATLSKTIMIVFYKDALVCKISDILMVPPKVPVRFMMSLEENISEFLPRQLSKPEVHWRIWLCTENKESILEENEEQKDL